MPLLLKINKSILLQIMVGEVVADGYNGCLYYRDLCCFRFRILGAFRYPTSTKKYFYIQSGYAALNKITLSFFNDSVNFVVVFRTLITASVEVVSSTIIITAIITSVYFWSCNIDIDCFSFKVRIV